MTITDTPLADILRHAPDGIVVAEGIPPRLSYANETLAALLRVPATALVGRALDDLENEAPSMPRDGDRVGRVDARAVEARRRLGRRLRALGRDAAGRSARALLPSRSSARRPARGVDRASGLATAEHLLETLRRDWSIGQRDGRSVTLLRFDVDACREYYEVFGRVATDNVLRQLGRTIVSAMRRTSDVVARFGDDEFVALGVAMEQASACAFAESDPGPDTVARDPSPALAHRSLLTMSAGVASAVPPRDRDCEALLDAAERALERAKHAGGNRVEGGELLEGG